MTSVCSLELGSFLFETRSSPLRLVRVRGSKTLSAPDPIFVESSRCFAGLPVGS
jgi:hypothetical protein